MPEAGEEGIGPSTKSKSRLRGASWARTEAAVVSDVLHMHGMARDSQVCDLNMAPLVPFPWRQRILIVMRDRAGVQCNRYRGVSWSKYEA